MTATPRMPGWPRLERLREIDFSGESTTPIKRINDGDDLAFFLSSTAYGDLMTWLFQLNRSMSPVKGAASSDKPAESRLGQSSSYSENIQSLRNLLTKLGGLIEQAPPDTGPRRFGNIAFRKWFKLAEDAAAGLLDLHLDDVLKKYGGTDDSRRMGIRDELRVYLLGSFGSAQRLDYGTGHELSFLAFLAGLWKLGAFQEGEEAAIVIGVVQPYLELIRKLVLTYTLEPAGSHGVWGLDDHSFAPYIFGSAQLGPAIDPNDFSKPVPTEGSLPTAPSPTAVTNKTLVGDYKDSNMYFSAIQFIYDVKRGPFWEHSPVLFDISGIKDGWGKINKGMLKMYAAEVLGKFPVVQHFPFGRLFAWKTDPNAVTGNNPSFHAQQQPKSMDVPPPPPPAASSHASAQSSTFAGTTAPWARSMGPQVVAGASTRPTPAAATGMPPTAAPWTNTARPAPGTGMPPTAAPWANTARPAPGTGMPPTAAPWAAQRRPAR